MTCDQCGQPARPEDRTTDGRFICDQCLRNTATWPVSRRGKRNLYGPSKPL